MHIWQSLQRCTWKILGNAAGLPSAVSSLICWVNSTECVYQPFPLLSVFVSYLGKMANLALVYGHHYVCKYGLTTVEWEQPPKKKSKLKFWFSSKDCPAYSTYAVASSSDELHFSLVFYTHTTLCTVEKKFQDLLRKCASQPVVSAHLSCTFCNLLNALSAINSLLPSVELATSCKGNLQNLQNTSLSHLFCLPRWKTDYFSCDLKQFFLSLLFQIPKEYHWQKSDSWQWALIECKEALYSHLGLWKLHLQTLNATALYLPGQLCL